jgi:hypothetical protein
MAALLVLVQPECEFISSNQRLINSVKSPTAVGYPLESISPILMLSYLESIEETNLYFVFLFFAVPVKEFKLMADDKFRICIFS